ncbi:uncharacterized protein EDB91DRAFT_1173807 [Suillus paluster]|uniref:uncharacterized protein n=1 Tax=Suillus paluster TaxID=48578 RepID=UPI001B8843C0|nr:uncharacterized protein EDB91DRAFT_1173807 [Suillus paluster]KAG1723037.1 hypothetical protein EDB91DRAFT_1173807 [Suillus paluster]
MPVLDQPRTDLNNILQAIYGPAASDHVRWEVSSKGPHNSPTWSATVYIDDMEHGHAQAGTIDAAKDSAARQACNHLKRERSQ